MTHMRGNSLPPLSPRSLPKFKERRDFSQRYDFRIFFGSFLDSSNSIVVVVVVVAVYMR